MGTNNGPTTDAEKTQAAQMQARYELFGAAFKDKFNRDATYEETQAYLHNGQFADILSAYTAKKAKPDATDTLVRDTQSGALVRARSGGGAASFLGQAFDGPQQSAKAFDPTQPLGRDSFLGDF